MGICDKVDWNFNDFRWIFFFWITNGRRGIFRVFAIILMEIYSRFAHCLSRTFHNPASNWGFCGRSDVFASLFGTSNEKLELKKLLFLIFKCAFVIMSIIMKCRGCLLNATWGHQCGKKAIKRTFCAFICEAWKKFIQIHSLRRAIHSQLERFSSAASPRHPSDVFINTSL